MSVIQKTTTNIVKKEAKSKRSNSKQANITSFFNKANVLTKKVKNPVAVSYSDVNTFETADKENDIDEMFKLER